MQTLTHHTPHCTSRISNNRHRHTHALREDFEGLEEDVQRYDLLLLVKKAGRAGGFSPAMVELLDYYMAYTRDIDWEEGSNPIVYQSIARTALDLGKTERHIRRIEKQLFEAGAISWNDSGNYKRYGQRCAETGKILYAFGIDLTPLFALRATLQNMVHDKQLYDAAWMDAKRQISWYRSQIRATVQEMIEEGTQSACAFDNAYNQINGRIQTSMDLSALHALRDQHKELFEAVIEGKSALVNDEMHSKMSPTADKNGLHIQSTTHKSFNKLNTCSDTRSLYREERSETSAPRQDRASRHGSVGQGEDIKPANDQEALILQTGMQHISLKQALNAASERFRDSIPLNNRAINWADIVEAAYRLKPLLKISQANWVKACQLLGKNGAALCVLITDNAVQRLEDPVRNPAAYFNGVINKAHKGELKLHQSIFGALQAAEEGVYA